MKKRKGLTTLNFLLMIIIFLSFVVSVGLIDLAIRTNARLTNEQVIAEPNTDSSYKSVPYDSNCDEPNCYTIGYSGDEHGTGCTVRYLKDLMVRISIVVDKTEVKDTEKKAAELLKTAKKMIEQNDKIISTETITDIDGVGFICQEFKLTLKSADPNSPPSS
ncbi:hypothetical protein KJ786_02625 [Patescibacteria group bacterium]|nr:hypothetical protein [Patescibacteria group bacterium]